MSDSHATTKSVGRQAAMGVMLILALGSLAACGSPSLVNYTPTAVVYVAPTAAATPTALVPTATPPPTATATPVISGPRLLRLEPSVVLDFAVGDTHAVEILLENIEDLHEVELHISFEPRYVRIEDADAAAEGVQIALGSFPAPAQVVQNEVNNDAGLIVYHVSQAEGDVARGSGTVASFTVRALSEGGSPLRFSIVKLLDAAGEPLPEPEQINGLVTISAGGAEAPTAEVTQPAQAATVTPIALPTTAPAATSTAGGTTHIVQRGENLYRIALRYGTTVDAIVAANNLADAGSIFVGQVLVIPGSAPAGKVTYVVQRGDTVYSIAKRYGTSVETLASLNGLTAPYTIKVGQTLIVSP